MRQDPDSAIYWFRKGAETGNPKALNNIAYLLLFPADSERVFLPANADSIAAAYLKKGQKPDWQLRKPCSPTCTCREEGFRPIRSGRNCSIAAPPRKDFVEADRSLAILMTGLSDSDSTGRALTLLGNAYAHGRGVPYDYSKAMECYLKAAEAGNPAAMFILAESLDMFPDILHGLGAPTTSPHIFFVSRLPKRNSHGRRGRSYSYTFRTGGIRNPAVTLRKVILRPFPRAFRPTGWPLQLPWKYGRRYSRVAAERRYAICG